MDQQQGVVRGRSPGRGWTQVTRGIHVLDPGEDTGDAAGLVGWQLLLPAHGCSTHLTGAAVCGWWLPPLPEGLPVFVSIGQRDPRPLRAGVRSLRLARACTPDLVRGLRVAPAHEVLLACAQDLGLVDLVVLLDGAAHCGDVDLDELRVACSTTLRGRRGVGALRRALDLADHRSESPWETLLRLLHVLCGIEVEPQHEVLGPHGLIARGDLWLVGTRSLHEYDGEVHLPRLAQKRDLRRLRRLDDAHWTRRGYVADDVVHRAVGILRDADRAVGRAHRPELIRGWHDALKDSLFTPAGTATFLARIGASRAA